MPITISCDQCGANFNVPPTRVRRGNPRFCSQTCFGNSLRRPITERLWEKVDKSGDCWLWTGSTHEHGYGRIGTFPDGHRHDLYVHRIAWEEASGRALVAGEDVCHTCDISACVRNDEVGTYAVGGRTFVRYGHLFAATQRSNNEDRDRKGRVRHGERHSNAKLTLANVERARILHATGAISGSALARMFGVSPATMTAAIRGDSWKRDA